jgi:hypothetical protein
MEERPVVNYTLAKKSFEKAQIGVPPDTVKTLKKNFQPRSMKNYKNMIKYESN